MIRFKSAWLAAAAFAAAPTFPHAQAQEPAKPAPVRAAPPSVRLSPPPLVAPPASPAAAPASTALASKADFPQCDGYGAPTSSGDGMTEYAMNLGLFSLPSVDEATEQQAAAKGREGVTACNRALPAVPDKFWMRRVSILRSRAMHFLEFGDAKSALADLDECDRIAAGHKDPYFDRSLGLGVKFVRAYALRHLGDPDQADGLAMQALAERPLNRMTGLLGLLAVGADGRPEDVTVLKRAYAKYQPVMLDSLYHEALFDGRYDEAAGLYPQLVPRLKNGDERWPKERRWRNHEDNRATTEMFWLSRGFDHAYMLAASAPPAKAREALAAVRKRFDEAIADPPALPPPPARGSDAKYRDAEAKRALAIETNLRMKEAAKPHFEEWDRLIDLRLRVAAGDGDGVLQDVTARAPRTGWASNELLYALAKALPAKHVSIEKTADDIHARLTHGYKNVPADGIAMMWSTLPEPETPKRAPPMKPATDLWSDDFDEKAVDFHQQTEGYRALQRTAGAPIIVRYRGMRGTGLMTEEITLLRAAELALQNNFKGFVILERRDNRWSQVETYYGTAVTSNPAGFESELDIVFVDPANLAAPYAATPWRVVEAEAVIAALRPIYGTYTPPKHT